MIRHLPQHKSEGPSPDLDFKGGSKEIRRLLAQTLMAARGGDRPILITGGVGVGKTHLARHIHRLSARARGPLVLFDCGAAPDLQNLLFGHRKGVFTDAKDDLGGRLKEADGGILVLDDFERLNNHQQDQLHRVVVDGGYYPLGANRPEHINVRFIATTNKDVRAEVEAGRLKRDFVSRLDYFELHIPSLHQRTEDIPVLCSELLRRNLEDLVHKGIRSDLDIFFDEDCWPALQARYFDDNVRGLDKLIVRLIARVEIEERSVITPGDIEAVFPSIKSQQGYWFDQPSPLRTVRDAAERQYILDICRYTDFNLRRVARILEISPKSLYVKLKQYGIVRP
jgi:DNA-binding NtrC family response regulator